MKRRQFLTRGALSGAAAILPLAGALGAGDSSPLTKRMAVAAPVGVEYVVSGPAVSGTGPRLTLVAEIASYDRLPGSGKEGKVRAMGNTLSYWENGLHVTIESLPPAEYARRLAEMESGTYGEYCHDSVYYRPGKSGLMDPHGLFGGESPVVIPAKPLSADLATAFRTVVRGMLAAGDGSLAAGCSAEFVAERERLLERSPRGQEEAGAIATALLQHIVPLAGTLSEREMAALLTSRLVSAALVLSDGRATRELLRAELQLRARNGKTDRSTRWLAVMLGAGATETDAPARATGSDDPYAAELTREVLPGALALLSARQVRIPAAGEGLAAQDFATWQSFHSPAAGSDPESDSDGDGLTALVEYGLGLDPGEFSRKGVPQVREEGGSKERYLTMTYRRDLTRTDVVYRVETSTNLAQGDWTTVGVSDEPEGVKLPARFQMRQARVRRDGPRRFLRLRIDKVE